ncbi:MaoC family dehydratase [Rhodococcus sp. 14C212]|nr:MaoC family dehydratase [Rhodococcus sp. 14C212]NGP04973.1 MaoC family dehydratase [Rhodococcus sp. 14C212]
MNSNPVRAPAPHEAAPDASAGPRTSQGVREVGEPDLDSFPLVPKGNKYEDFELGQTMTHHWGRTLTEADNVSFSTATCAWLPLHLNVEYARSQGHPDTVLNPMLVLCTAVGLSVEDLSESGGPFLGIDDCVFVRPAYPGDTIVATSRVLEMRPSASKPGVGIVTWHTTATNQHSETVVEFVRTNLVAARDRQRTT